MTIWSCRFAGAIFAACMPVFAAWAQDVVEFRDVGVRIRGGGEFSRPRELTPASWVKIVTIWSAVNVGRHIDSHFLAHQPRDPVAGMRGEIANTLRGQEVQDVDMQIFEVGGDVFGAGLGRAARSGGEQSSPVMPVFTSVRATYLPRQRRAVFFWGMSLRSQEDAEAQRRDLEERTDILSCRYEVGPGATLGCH
jgi:hypothetical protein